MFWVAEWHKSGTSTHTHLLLKGEVTGSGGLLLEK